MVLLAKSICDHQSEDISLLLFRQGDVIHVMEQLDTGWWDGICHGRRGWFPSHFVTFLTEEELKAVEAQIPEWLNTEESELIKGIKDLRFAEKKIPHEKSSNSIKGDTTPIIQHRTGSQNEEERQKFLKQNKSNLNGELLKDHTNGLGKSSEYKKEHNETNNNVDSGISVTEDIGIDHTSLDSIGDQINESDWYLKQREEFLSNLYKEATPNKFVDCPEPLPLFWGYKQDARQEKYYINLLSQDCTRSLPAPDPVLNSMLGSTRPISPMSSDDSDGTESVNNFDVPNAEVLARRNRKPSNFMSNKLTNSRSGSGDLSVATTWDTIASELTLAIYSLNSAIKRKIKWDYMYHTNVSIHRVKNILRIVELANLSRKDSQVEETATIASSEQSEGCDQSVKFHTNQILSFTDERVKTVYYDLLKQLTELIFYARSASSVWPSPEAGTDLLSHSEKTLTLTKNLISLAQELKIPADSNSEELQDIMNTINHKFESEDQSCELLFKVSNMAAEVSSLVTQIRRLINDYPDITFKTSKRLVLSVGEILAVVNGFTLHDCNEHLASIFNSDKSRAFEEIGNLVVTLQSKSSSFINFSHYKQSPSYKSMVADLNHQTLITAARAETAIYRLLVSGKILIDDRDQFEQFLLKKEIDRFLGNIDSGRSFLGSEKIFNLLDFKPRRPMSMTFHHIPLVSPSVTPTFEIDGPKLEVNQNIQRSLSTPANVTTDQPIASGSSSQMLDPNLAPLIANRHSSSRSVASSISSLAENLEDTQLPISIPSIRTNSIRKLEETPWFLKPDYDPDHIVLVDNVAKGGTLGALIERLTAHDHLDTSFIMTFLLTYRTFTNTVEFLDLLFRRYSLSCPMGLQPDDQELWREKKLKPVRLRVFSVLKTWLESFYLEEEDSRGLENLRHFASTTMSESNTASANVLLRLVHKRKESSDGNFRKMVRSLREAPTPLLPKNLSKFKLLDLEPLEIARQLTIVDSKLYNNLKPVEFLNKAWSRKDNISSPNVTKLIERFNQVNYWVAESILTQQDAKKRCTVIRRFISVAESCAVLNNFSGVMAILAGFNMAPVFRLKRTWDLITGKPLLTLESLKKTMDSSKNFAEYRELLHSVNPPCVPFLGVYLTDLTFNEDGNPNYMPKQPHLINFGKQAKTAEIIREIQGYQNSHYNLDAVAEVQDFLTEQICKAKNLAQLYELSLQMEPKEREDEKIARLLHESGFL